MSDIPMLEPIAVWAQPSATTTNAAAALAPASAVPAPVAAAVAPGHAHGTAAGMEWERSAPRPPATSASAASAAPAAASAASSTAAASYPAATASAPAQPQRSVAASLAMYEVVDLLDDDEDDEDSDEEGADGRGAAAAAAAQRTGAFSGVAVAGAPAVERFTIDLSAGLRAVSGRALRRQRYPQAYPPTPPPEPEPEPAAAAPAASGEANGKKARRKRKKRDAALDYYDTSDSFIDDSELFDDGDIWPGQGQESESSAPAAAKAVEHAMSPAQLRELLSRFAVTSAAALLDDEDDDESSRAHQLQPTKKLKKNSKFVSPEKAEGDKEREKERDKTARSNKGDKAGAIAAANSGRKRKEDGEKKKDKAAKELGSGGGGGGGGKRDTKGKDGTEKKKERSKRPPLAGAAVVPGEAGSSVAPIVLSGWGETDELGSPTAAAAADSTTPRSPTLSAAAAAAPPLPPPPPADIGKLHKDWLQCFDRFPATPAVVSLLEDILAEGNLPQQPGASAAAAGSAPPPQPPSPSRQSSMQSNASTSAGDADDSKMTDVTPSGDQPAAEGTDSVPSSQPAASGSGAAAAGAAVPTRAGLRHKPNTSLAATRQPHKLPDSLSKLLTRLGALLETQVSDESTVATDEDGAPVPVDKDAAVNKFAAMLSRELVWTRGTIKQRLTVGRLEGQVARYLTERFNLYERLRDAVRADVRQQTEAAGAAAAASQSTEWYKPNWPSFMRLLLDFVTYTDDLTEALEELEQWAPKKVVKESGTTDAEAKADVAQARIAVLASAWSTLPIPASSYPPSHHALLTSVTENVYASLPVLWAQQVEEGQGEGEGRPCLMDECTIERTIDEAEKRYAAEQEEAARLQREAQVAEEARIEAERIAQEAVAEAAAKAEAERKAAVERERELQRKKEKAAARAAAAAAAAAASSSGEGESKEAPSSTPAAGGGAESGKKEKVRRRPKAEIRGEGAEREKQCFGPLCTRPAADGSADGEGTWHLLTDFSPSVGGAGGVLSRCRPCENLIRKKAKAAAAAAAAGSGSAALTAGAPGPAPAPKPRPVPVRLPSLPVCSAVFALVPPAELRWKVPPTVAPRMQPHPPPTPIVQLVPSPASAPSAAAVQATVVPPAAMHMS